MTHYPIFEKLRELASTQYTGGRLHTEDEIKAAEKRHNVSFPHDYRTYLLYYSDIYLPYYDYEMRHFYDDTSPGFKEFKFWRREFNLDSLIPFAGANSNFFCFELMGRGVAKIRYWSHDYHSDETWDSFADWVEQEWVAVWLRPSDESNSIPRRNRGDDFDANELFKDIKNNTDDTT